MEKLVSYGQGRQVNLPRNATTNNVQVQQQQKVVEQPKGQVAEVKGEEGNVFG